MVRNPSANARDTSSVHELGRSPGDGHVNPPQYSHLRNSRKKEPGGLQSVGLQETDTT